MDALGKSAFESRVHRFLVQHRHMRRELRDRRGSGKRSSSSLSTGTMRETRPERSASAASIMRPVRQRSIAFAFPTARVRRCEPPKPASRQA